MSTDTSFPTDGQTPGEHPTGEQVPGGGGRRGTHPLSAGHLVMGVVFLVVAAGWALVASGLLGVQDVRWLLPVPWVLGGGVGLAALALRGRRRPDRPGRAR